MNPSNQPLSKQARLLALAKKRQQAKWEGYKNVGDYHDGKYDCDFASPYTKSANNMDSQLLIMLQDWASEDFLNEPLCEVTRQCGRTPSRETNKRLDTLVKKYFGVAICETFASNLFPFIKPKSMSSKIPTKYLVLAAKEFALPQIEIVAPRLVVALGLDCFNGFRRALNMDPSRTIARGAEDRITFCGSTIWCQAHTSRLGQNMRNRGGVDRVAQDWQEMAGWFNAPRVIQSEASSHPDTTRNSDDRKLPGDLPGV